VTHNMAEAIRWGNRLIMMHEGRIAFEVCGTDKAALSIGGLIDRFHAAVGADLVEDRVLLGGNV